MSIKATKLQYEVKRKLNRINTDYAKSVPVSDVDAALNEAKDLVYENFAAIVELSPTIRNHLRELESKRVFLDPEDCNDDTCFYKYPSNFYRLMRQEVIATREGCSDRELIVHISQSDDLSESVKDPYWSPSFDYEETLGDEAGNGLHVYKGTDFDLGKLKISYLKKLPDVATPSLTKLGSYTNSDGDTVSTDADLQLDSTYLWRKMVDVAVVILHRDMGNSQDFQAQVNKILGLDKLYLQ